MNKVNATFATGMQPTPNRQPPHNGKANPDHLLHAKDKLGHGRNEPQTCRPPANTPLAAKRPNLRFRNAAHTPTVNALLPPWQSPIIFVVMTYKYRTANPSDAIACSQIIRDWGDETPWMVPIDHLESMARFWADQFENDLAWVGETDKGIIGFCARSDDNISALYVSSEARNRGVGKALLDLAKADRDWITVWAYEKNDEARRFYQREGLVEVCREMEIFDDGSRLMDVEHRWVRSI